MPNFTTTELSVDAIRASLIVHLKNSGKFNDFDFEGSAISSLLDILAYNTHFNALNANFGLNESFLDSAQLRGSIVSHAKPLNYLPKTKTGATATITVTLLSVPPGTSDITIPKNTKFSTSIDGVTYLYHTLDEHIAKSSDNYSVTGVVIKEGQAKTKKFFVDAEVDQYPVYVIPDENFDSGTATVALFEGFGSTNSITLSLPGTVSTLDGTSNIYLLHEAPNGFYEIFLGDGVMGAKPAEGSILQIDYLSSNGAASNGASVFSLSGQIAGFAASVSTTTKAAGGADKESIESIRFNAPLAFAAQNRVVTVADYRAHILNFATFIESINVWGGEDNPEREYGKVFIAIKPVGADAITATQESQIRVNALDDKAIVTVRFEFVDPTFEFLVIKMNYLYNPSKTTLTKQQIDNAVKDSIVKYGTDNLVSFDSPFRKSNLTTTIDASNDAIASSEADVNVQRRFIPTLGAKDSYTVEFTLPLAPVTRQPVIVSSNAFVYTIDGVNFTCFLRNISGKSTLEIFRISGSNEIIVVDDAGQIDYANNSVVINPFQPTAFGSDNFVAITAVPLDDSTVMPLRNMLLRIENDAVAANGVEDTTA